MTAIEITTETPTEMYCLLNLIKKMEVKDSEAVPPVQKIKMPEPMPAVEGLGKEQEASCAEEEVEKLVEDLRSNASWLEGDKLAPPDLKNNLLKAARILEIECTRREHHRLGDYANDKRILDVIRKP